MLGSRIDQIELAAFMLDQYLPYFEQEHYDTNNGPESHHGEPVNQIPYLEGYDIAQDPADRFFGWERYICHFRP